MSFCGDVLTFKILNNWGGVRVSLVSSTRKIGHQQNCIKNCREQCLWSWKLLLVDPEIMTPDDIGEYTKFVPAKEAQEEVKGHSELLYTECCLCMAILLNLQTIQVCTGHCSQPFRDCSRDNVWPHSRFKSLSAHTCDCQL